MWPQNSLTEKLNLRFPIFQAPMGEHSTPDLAAAVSNAGGLGGLGMWGFSADEGENRILAFRQQCAGSLNVNYPLWPATGDLTGVGMEMRAAVQALYDRKGIGAIPTPEGLGGLVGPSHLEMLIRTAPKAVSFHFGLPEQHFIDALRENGIAVLCSATTVEEAKILEGRGVDVVIAQSFEAGGHQGAFAKSDERGRLGMFALLPQVVDAVSVPVVAAGGIADGRGVAAALMLGASGVQLGTAFLRCHEANISEGYRSALAEAKDVDTVITEVISGRPARAISNKLVDELESAGATPLPFPAQYELTLPLDDEKDSEFLGLLSGQSVALTREMAAANLVSTLVNETTLCLSLNVRRGESDA